MSPPPARGALPWTGAMLLAAAVHGALLLMPLPDRAPSPPPSVTLRLARVPAEAPPAETPDTSHLEVHLEVPGTSGKVPGTSGDTLQIDQIAPAEAAAVAPPAEEPAVIRGLEGVPGTSPRVPDTSGSSPIDQIVRGPSGLAALAPVVPPPPPWNAHAYGNRVRQRIEAHQRYPARARRQAQEGETLIAVTVRADGHLTAPPRLVRSSGVAALDREALRMARAAAPFPPPAASAPLVIQVPVRFSLAAP